MIWTAYQPTAETPWNIQRVVHLHRRASFSAPWSVIQRDLKAGPAESIARLLGGNTTDKSEGLDNLTRAIGDAAIASGNPQRLKAWWLYQMVTTCDPLGERLALMWHSHFATSNRKVKNLVLMKQQNELFRKHGRGRFAELLAAVVKHPAMMLWLDADSNRKGKPNENLARELLELFTVGVGNFTERDVKESARALTGWTVISDKFENRTVRHDEGQLEILGKSQPFTGDQLLEMLLEHPATARRIAWRLCKTFMSESFVAKEEGAVDELARGLVENDLNISWAVETILNSEAFFSESNIRSKVLGPAEYIVGLVRSLELNDPPPGTMVLADWLTRMGLDLFYPPNVGGWNEGRAWLGSRNVIARANFAAALCDGNLRKPTTPPNLDQFLASHSVAGKFDAKVRWLATLLWGEVPDAEVVSEIVEKVSGEQSKTAAALQLLLSRPENMLG